MVFRVDLPLLCVALLFVAAASGDGGECTKQSACVCHSHGDESSLDITQLMPKAGDFISATKGSATYYYAGCNGHNLDPPKTVNVTVNECEDKASALCKLDTSTNTTKILLLGLTTEAVFKMDPLNTKQTIISYDHNKIVSTVTFVCTPDYHNATMQVDSIKDNAYTLTVFSAHACRFHDPHGMSTGSKMLVILLVFALIYLVGGSCLSYFLRGARGREVIPNVDFWMGLPGLVKDGVIFVLNGCNSRMVSTAETYDQI